MKPLFEEASIEKVLCVVQLTAVGKRREALGAHRIGEWDIELVDRGSDED